MTDVVLPHLNGTGTEIVADNIRATGLNYTAASFKRKTKAASGSKEIKGAKD